MITIYGASDDLIEIDGDIQEEFNYYGDEGRYLAFSDGTVLHITYSDETDGIWRIKPVVVPDASALTITQAPADESAGYTDRAELRSDCKWVVFGTAIANRHWRNTTLPARVCGTGASPSHGWRTQRINQPEGPQLCAPSAPLPSSSPSSLSSVSPAAPRKPTTSTKTSPPMPIISVSLGR